MNIRRPKISLLTVRILFLTLLIFPSIITVCSAQSGEKDIYKWLPEKQDLPSIAPEVDDFLKFVNGRMRLLYCKYDKAKLINSCHFRNEELKIEDEEWKVDVKANSVESDQMAMDLDIIFRLKAGIAKDAGVAVAFDFENWSTDNYVMIPASVYNGNRVKIVDRGYNEGIPRELLYKKDIPLISVPIPHLSMNAGDVSLLEVNASNMASPAMCFFNKKEKRGFIVLTQQKTQFDDNGFIIEENADRSKASFVISAPGVREKKPLFVGFTKSDDRGVDLNAGDKIEIKLRVHSFTAEDIPGFLDKFMQVRKAVTGKNNSRNLIPFSQISEMMTNRIDERWYEGDEYQFYCPENANWISFGWIGGLINTFPMLALNDDMHRERVKKTFDFAIPRGQAKTGYFNGALNFDGKNFPREGYPDMPELALTRKNGDVLFWMIKQFELLKAQGNYEMINPIWEQNIKRLADAFVSTWKKNGQWGRLLNIETGEVAEYNTSGGVIAIAGLALASKYFELPAYLEIAKEAAKYYYQNDFENQGSTTGCCADILQNADSETSAGFMEALMALYEITGNNEWLEKSRNLANLTSTWTTSYDYELPKETELGRLGAKLAGVYWASTQNKHGAPGICTSSGDSLFKIYRATGNKLYAELLNDIVHAYGESIRPEGYTNERLTYCDAEPGSVGNRGTHITGWNELNGFLMALEIPGIYLQPDSDEFFVFDSVEAKILNRNENGVTLRISNPTNFDANVSILVELKEQVRKPLGYISFINWPKVSLEVGQTKIVKIDKKGKIIFTKGLTQ